MTKQSGPAVAAIADAAALKALEEASDISVVGFFAADSEEGKAFAAAADSLREDYSFHSSSDAALASSVGVSVPAVVVFKPFDEKRAIFSGSITSDALSAFVKKQALPLFGEIGPENYQKYLDRELPLTWVFLDYEADNAAAISEACTKVAAEVQETIIFCKLDGERWGDHAKSMGLKKATPGVVLMDPATRKNFVFPEDRAITAETLREFTADFAAGKLVANVRSQEAPEKNDGNVKVIVGSTFDEIVMNNEHDVLVEFYAPWCGHCKSLTPKYEKLGAKFAGNPNVIIAKIDATENDHPADVEGFPTIIFYPAGAKDAPIPYEGDRTTDAMYKFVVKNGKAAAPAAKAEETKAETPVKEEL